MAPGLISASNGVSGSADDALAVGLHPARAVLGRERRFAARQRAHADDDDRNDLRLVAAAARRRARPAPRARRTRERRARGSAPSTAAPAARRPPLLRERARPRCRWRGGAGAACGAVAAGGGAAQRAVVAREPLGVVLDRRARHGACAARGVRRQLPSAPRAPARRECCRAGKQCVMILPLSRRRDAHGFVPRLADRMS